MSGGKEGGSSYDPTMAYQAGMADYSPNVDWKASGSIDPGSNDYAAFSAGWDQAAADRKMTSMFESFGSAGRSSQETQDNKDYQQGLYGAMTNKDSAFSDIAEADLRIQRMGTEDDSGYEDFVGTLSGQHGDNYGYVWDPEQSYKGSKDLLGGTGAGAWRAVGAEEYADLAANVGTTMSKYGGLVNAEGHEFGSYGENTKEFDALLSQRFDMATESATATTAQINTDTSRAELFGLTYELTPEQRAGKINDSFAGLWSEENESRLTELGTSLQRDIDHGGVERGIESGTTQVKDTQVGTPLSAPIAVDEEDEGLLTSTSVF